MDDVITKQFLSSKHDKCLQFQMRFRVETAHPEHKASPSFCFPIKAQRGIKYLLSHRDEFRIFCSPGSFGFSGIDLVGDRNIKTP